MNQNLLFSHVRLCVTNACPNSCSFCYRQSLEKARNSLNMSEEVAFKSIEFIFKELPRTEDFTLMPWGGEPLLRFDLIKKIVDKYPQLSLQSNTSGSVMSQEMYNFFIREGRNYFLVWSLGNAYEKYGGIRQKVEAHPLMAKLVRERNLIVNFTVTNYDTLIEDYNYLISEGFGRVAVQQLLGYDFKDEELALFMGNLLKILEEGKRGGGFLPDFISGFNPINDTAKNMVERSLVWYKEFGPSSLARADTFCNSGIQKLFIDTDGGIWQCDGFYINGQNKLGNIWDGIDWTKLDIQISMWENQDKAMYEYCNDCDIKDVCPSTKCLATNYRLTGDYLKLYPGFCKFNHALVDLFRQYIEDLKGGELCLQVS